MGTTPGSTLRTESGRWPASTRKTRPAASALLALAVAVAGCSSAQPNTNRGGTGDTGGEGDPGDTGGKTGTGGKVGGSTGGKAGGDTGGSGGGMGGAGGMGTGGAPAADAGPNENPSDAATGTMADTGSSSSGDA